MNTDIRRAWLAADAAMKQANVIETRLNADERLGALEMMTALRRSLGIIALALSDATENVDVPKPPAYMTAPPKSAVSHVSIDSFTPEEWNAASRKVMGAL
ncbi:hypothetical protein GCM10010922_01290 [Microbacterium sorbitolivorans]|uniref:Uncharacterized protein n=1 Tax=Microbacterium sorbitolivorans TaxID=1867410 RepID=A0A367Y743_9MICO|nr:hypothetical protein [Microbacterium sorbitolivorans]RCK61684.1 hypothetical protein DTO57_03390 [Microbacterium sorbitolivorans]GGF30095.1 hypothetical protein GCM10010922_01290 [Microbacterium sorbitolivorans]